MAQIQLLVSHPTGNANLRAVLQGLAAGNVLSEFHTTIATNPQSPWLKLLPASVASDLLRRSYSVSPGLIYPHSFFEWGRMLSQKFGVHSLHRHETGVFSVDSVYKKLDLAVAKRICRKAKPSAVYAYEDGAEHTFERARQCGIPRLYDLPIGYYRAFRHLMEQERQIRPQWAETLTGFRDSPQKLARKDRELALADHIFVASTFTKHTLEYYQGSLPEISVIPYGFPPPAKNRLYEKTGNRPLKLLFVGGLSQRKGIANMFEAVAPFKEHVELTVIGRKAVENCTALNSALSRHRYIPSLPHHQVLAQMQQADVLLFPSLFEGFGLVVTEAMSQGTPVIASERTCAPDLIKHGQNGWIEPAGDTLALQNRLEFLLSNPHLLEEIGRNALTTAAQRPWSAYGSELTEKILQLRELQPNISRAE